MAAEAADNANDDIAPIIYGVSSASAMATVKVKCQCHHFVELLCVGMCASVTEMLLATS